MGHNSQLPAPPDQPLKDDILAKYPAVIATVFTIVVGVTFIYMLYSGASH